MTHHHDHDALVGGLVGFGLGWLVFDGGRPHPRGHQHGEYWHTHETPRGYHVHDGTVDGPIRLVPPTPQQRARSAAIRKGWLVAIGDVAGMFVVFIGSLAAMDNALVGAVIISTAFLFSRGARLIGLLILGALLRVVAALLRPFRSANDQPPHEEGNGPAGEPGTARPTDPARPSHDRPALDTARLSEPAEARALREARSLPETIHARVDGSPGHTISLTDLEVGEPGSLFPLSGRIQSARSYRDLDLAVDFRRSGRTIGQARVHLEHVQPDRRMAVQFTDIVGYDWRSFDAVKFRAWSPATRPSP